MKHFFKILVVVLCAAAIGCSKKDDKPAEQPTIAEQPPKLDTKGVLLQTGYAALLVAFPEPKVPGDWLSLVTLEGEHNTDALPRIPLSATRSVMVMNVPPGTYTVTGKAWVRKASIYSAGVSNPVTLEAGELYVLLADYITMPDGSFEGVALRDKGSSPWALKSPAELSKYIAENAERARG